MDVLYLVLPLALVFVLVGVALFVWAARSGQFDDLETPAHRALFDDAPAPQGEDSPAQTQRETADRQRGPAPPPNAQTDEK